MGDGKGARNEGVVIGIELAFDPVGPHPVQVVLDHPAVDEAAGMEHHSGAQQLHRLAHLGGLGEAVQTRQHGHRVEETVGARQAAN